ncbi:S24 family peptidase [Luteolibacter pohnpeiensis]|uniref:S24 family peptidase n=1 Tax=Luteolibacter pohnpeiensis TaxID=454153 RepID=A0A934SEC6_9BACT|nr:S24 family peptidase [Luteolibacter pohnpeiensis]MBK1883638.1 S24 family peptidase [Luteolibacter pohnpeiensis]
MKITITPQEIQAWLDHTQRDRDWLAEQTGAAKGTIANWLAANKRKPIPEPTLRLIERLMCDDLLGEPQFSFGEAKMIRQAMDQEGYKSLRDFMRDAVIANARLLTSGTQDAEIVPDSIIAFPEIPLHYAAAGQPVSSDIDYYSPTKDYGRGRFACTLHGDSMSPKFPDGSTVILRERESLSSPFLKKGEIYLFVVNGEKTLKIYNTRLAKKAEIEAGISYISEIDGKSKVKILKSINPEFPEIIAKEPIEWIGWFDKSDNK